MYSMESNTETKQLRYGTTVICNGKIGVIKSVSKTDNINVQLFDDNSIVSIKKNKLKIIPHSKNELIKYKNIYYVIGNMSLDINLPIYELNYVNSGFNKSKKKFCLKIQSTDKNIISIDKKNQEKTISYLKFLDRYNSTVNYLNKKTGKIFDLLNYKTVDKDMDNLFDKCRLRINQLDKISNTMKKCQELNIQIKFIIINPFNFITQDYQLLTYERAEKICTEYELNIDFKINLEKLKYCLFLNDKKTFYLPKWLYEQEMEKFCRYRQENHIKFKTFIKTIVIEKNIDKTIWVTTTYLIGVEKDMTDLMMELFYKDSYDIPEDKINQLVCIYEERKRKSGSRFTSFSLEPEQKTSVIKSIQNKLSIITGPPGTGKTEISKCINYCLYELYKIENPDENTDTTSIIDNSEDDEYEDQYEDQYDQYEDDNSEVYSEYNDDFSVTSDICIECDESNKYINPRTISLMAPTGLAFINMNRSQEAKHYNNKISGTCHRLLYHTIPNIKKHKKPKYCDCDCEDKKDCKYNMDIKLIELDEASMLDTFLLYELLKVCKYFNSRLILLGDVEQLPSIGPGKILQQLIESQVFTVTKLTKIKRQNSGALVNNILKMSKEIVQVTDFVDDSMVLYNIDDFMVNKEISIDAFYTFISSHNLNKDDTKFITGFNTEKKIFNTKTINNLIQNKFNPENIDFEYDKIPSNYKYENSFIFRIKDKIIRTENDYSSEKMRANGEEAEIIDFDGLNQVTIKYSGADDKPERIGINELYENFTLNYCVTVHKSQGSQYKNVVFFIEPEQTFIEKKMIYTAISRAQTRCFVISRPNDFISLQKSSNKIDFKVSLFMKESDNYEFPN